MNKAKTRNTIPQIFLSSPIILENPFQKPRIVKRNAIRTKEANNIW
jgi:hypothetical protein